MGMGRSKCFLRENQSAYILRSIAGVSVVLNIILIIVLVGTCYYFSTEEKNWTSSQNFCSSYNASLATIENEEKIFVIRYGREPPYWVGLTRCAGKPWKWLNGQNATLKVLGEGENCAYLSDEEEAIISRCSTEHRWICSKSVNATDT